MGVKNISAIELAEILKVKELPIIDIRPEAEYNLKHIPKSQNIPLGELLSTPERYLNRNRRYYIICDEGKKSIGLCFELGKMGFDVVNVLGGITQYKGPLITSNR
ncbi:MAG TPA: rhodanese-like domain-containing protein [Bacilli bacterium]